MLSINSLILATIVGALVAQNAPSADDAYKSHDYATAKKLYEAAVQQNPKDARAWYRLAVIAVHDKDDKAALSDLAGFSRAAPVPASAYRENAMFASFQGLPGYAAFVEGIERQQYPCRFDSAARAMDRWIGTWNVTNPNTGIGGSSVIERLYDGCVIVEHWHGQYGDLGTSLTSYDATTHRWHQHYVSDRALVTDYEGTADGSSVVFVSKTATGATRMTYVFLPDGRVEQRFETSSDDGKTWTPSADLYYEHAKN